MTATTKNRLKFGVKLIVAALLIGFVFRSGHLKIDSLKGLLTLPNATVLFGLMGLNIWLLNWRWYWLLKSRRFVVSLPTTFSLYLIGVFFNNVLPSSVGGDVVKAYYIGRDQSHRRVDAVLSVLIDRVLGLYSMLLLTLIGVALDLHFVWSHPEIKVMATLCAALVLGLTVALAIGFSRRLDRLFGVSALLNRTPRLQMIAKVFMAVQVYGELRLTILISILVSMVAQLVAVGFFLYVGWALAFPQIGLPAYLFCVPLGFVATALPIAPAGVGVGQVAFLFLFDAYSGHGDAGAIGITAFQLATLCWGMIGSIFYLKYKRPMEIATGA